MNISIFGLGYVGTVSVVALAKQGHSVIGVDTDPRKVDALRRGISPVVERGIQEALDEIRSTGRVMATTDAATALRHANMSMVCVGTPSKRRTGQVEYRYVNRVIAEITENLPQNRSLHPIVIRSTVFPDQVNYQSEPGSAIGLREKNIELVFHPEFLREGNALHDFFAPPMIVAGSTSKPAAEMVFSLYKGIEAPRFHVAPQTASFLKYASNCFHALKVGFANEIGRIAKELQVEVDQFTEMFLTDDKLNISAAYLRPGMSFGGSCLPKDLKAILAKCREMHVITPILNAVWESNREHTNFILDRILDFNANRLLFLGLSFKVGTDDLRESPTVEIVERLLGKGFDLRIWDPDLDKTKLVGQNREYVFSYLPHFKKLLVDDPFSISSWPEGVVVAKQHPAFCTFLDQLRGKVPVLDVTRVDG